LDLFGANEPLLATALLPTVNSKQYCKYEAHDSESEDTHYEVDHECENNENDGRHSQYFFVTQIEITQSKEKVQNGCN